MTNQESRAFLHSIREQDEELYRLLTEIAELRTAVENCTAKLDKDGSQSSKGGDKMSNLMCKIIDLERKCEKIRISSNGKRRTVLEFAKELTQDTDREYLIHRFVKCNGFYETAMELDLSDSKARRIDRKVVSQFAKSMAENKI